MRLRELNLSPATAPSAIGMPEAGGGHFACAVHVYYLAPVKSLDTCAPLHRSARLSQRLASELNVNAVNVEGSLFRSPWPLRLVACICTEKLIQGSPATPFISRWANEGRPVHRGGSQLQVSARCGSGARTREQNAGCRVLNIFFITHGHCVNRRAQAAQVHPYNAVFGKLLDAEKRSALPPRQEHVEPP